jgi:hypothetical protein
MLRGSQTTTKEKVIDMNFAKGTLCAIVAALTFGLSNADAKPTSWKYTPQRCGFELSYTKGEYGKDRTERRLEYDMRKEGITLTLDAPGKDRIRITAAEKKGKYRITSVENRTSLETCHDGKGTDSQCSKKVLMSAGKLVRDHMDGISAYKKRWRANDSGRCNIMGGW